MGEISFLNVLNHSDGKPSLPGIFVIFKIN